MRITYFCALLLLALGDRADGAPVWKLDASWPKPLPPSFNISRVTAVAVVNGTNGQKEIHVAQRGTAELPVMVFGVGGQLLRQWGAVNVTSIHGMKAQAGNPSTIWVTDAGDYTVKSFDPDGNVGRSVGTPGQPGGKLDPLQFSSPADVAIVTADGSVVVSDGDGGTNNRVVRLSAATLSTMYAIGGNGSAVGQFSSPHSVAYDELTDRLWVADRGNVRLQAFSAADGSFEAEWTSPDCLPGPPWGVRIDSARRNMFVADGLNNRLYVISLAGGFTNNSCSLLQTIEVGAERTPHELAVDADTGDVYVAGVGGLPTMLRYLYVQG